MLYCNCHYRYKGQLCKLLSYLPKASDEVRKVRVQFQNNTDVICSENDLEEIPLTELILQSCFKSKTYVRDGIWDVLWYLGGKNDVTIGEKQGQFYMIPAKKTETVVEVLPFELVQGQYVTGNKELVSIKSVGELEMVYPELAGKMSRHKIIR